MSNFADHGLAETHLDLNAYLSINPGDPRNGRFISTHLYKFGKRGKAIWTPLLCPQDVWKHRYVIVALCCIFNIFYIGLWWRKLDGRSTNTW
jgi:hypothetical protein